MEEKLIRLKEVLQLLPLSRTSWWAGVKSGKYPAPVKLGKRITCWKNSEIKELIKNGTEGERTCVR